MVPDPIGVDSLRRVLVVKLRHHGDVLLTSPVFRVLAARAPQAAGPLLSIGHGPGRPQWRFV